MTVLEQIHAAHNPALAAIEAAHVYQLWQDGEITLQKCGSLLWQRNLHCVESGFYHGIRPDQMPARSGANGYAFVSRDDAYRLRNLMRSDENASTNK